MKLPTNTNKEAPCPSSRTEQGQISCAHLGYPVFTNYLQSSPTETTAHSCQPKAHIHSPTLPLHSHIPFAIQKLHSRKENSLKLTGLPGLINWTAEAYWAQVTGWVWLSGFERQHKQAKGWRSQPIGTKALGCNRARSLARAKNDGESSQFTLFHAGAHLKFSKSLFSIYIFKSQQF